MSARLDAVGERLGFSADRRGLVRVLAATVVAYVALAFIPDRTHPLAKEAGAWAAVVVLSLLYAWTARVVRDAPAGTARVLWWAFPVVALAAACVWPFHSADVYLYENGGRLQSAHGLDPYVSVPADLPNPRADPTLTDLWDRETFPYGFLFAHEARVVAALAGTNLALAVALFKAVSVLALAAAGALVLSTARRLARERPDLAATLVLVSPFLLVHHVANAHNDLLAGVLVLAALRLAIDGRDLLAAGAVALAAAIKMPAAVVAPFLLLFAARRRAAGPEPRRGGVPRAALALVVAVLVFAATGWPYLAHVRDFRWKELAASWSEPSYSLHGALVGLYAAAARAIPALAGGEATFRTVTRLALAAAFLVFLALRLARARRRPPGDADGLVEDCVLVLIALLCVASSRYGAWYPAAFLPAALLLPDAHPLRRLSLLLAFAGLLGITFVGRARILDAIVMTVLPIAWILLERRRARAVSA